jgi:hypothetical protein
MALLFLALLGRISIADSDYLAALNTGNSICYEVVCEDLSAKCTERNELELVLRLSD